MKTQKITIQFTPQQWALLAKLVRLHNAKADDVIKALIAKESADYGLIEARI